MHKYHKFCTKILLGTVANIIIFSFSLIHKGKNDKTTKEILGLLIKTRKDVISISLKISSTVIVKCSASVYSLA